jgi:hypothetical protein
MHGRLVGRGEEHSMCLSVKIPTFQNRFHESPTLLSRSPKLLMQTPEQFLFSLLSQTLIHLPLKFQALTHSPLSLPVDAVRRVAHARDAPIVRKVLSDACFQSRVVLPSQCHTPAQTFAQCLQDALHVDLDTVHAGRGQVLVKLRASVNWVSLPSTEDACMENF